MHKIVSVCVQPSDHKALITLWLSLARKTTWLGLGKIGDVWFHSGHEPQSPGWRWCPLALGMRLAWGLWYGTNYRPCFSQVKQRLSFLTSRSSPWASWNFNMVENRFSVWSTCSFLKARNHFVSLVLVGFSCLAEKPQQGGCLRPDPQLATLFPLCHDSNIFLPDLLIAYLGTLQHCYIMSL